MSFRLANDHRHKVHMSRSIITHTASTSNLDFGPAVQLTATFGSGLWEVTMNSTFASIVIPFASHTLIGGSSVDLVIRNQHLTNSNIVLSTTAPDSVLPGSTDIISSNPQVSATQAVVRITNISGATINTNRKINILLIGTIF